MQNVFLGYIPLPIEERKNPIIVIEDEPINWKLIHEEISNETERGKTILKMLIELDII